MITSARNAACASGIEIEIKSFHQAHQPGYDLLIKGCRDVGKSGKSLAGSERAASTFMATRVTYFCPSPADTEAEKPFHVLWKKIGITIVPVEKVA
ncbi:hypothetical protein GH811_04605 [Acetobacterium malicum]|uniref:Uncharacterized protein n=1 Tax=Acetobacterium malicum TaxID=52692 RepID=A0ABR6YUM8_9FIRM|nr:hypothetical protein [Acetobacterium malicum]MBC3898893.1 hypothetical protein [Acetobacterium malicum]